MSVILIAEDDADVRYLLTRLFTRAEFTVLTAPDGPTALRTAIERHPDVVITDLNMPAMTGLHLCQAIRADPHLKNVPVGILSGSLLPGDPRVADAQVCGVWLKPFVGAELVTAVRRLLAASRHHHGDLSPCSLSTASA